MGILFAWSSSLFSLLQFVDAVVGNSSSGLLEAPSFNIATINIGDRQKGRVKGKSVIDVEPCQNLIRTTLEELFEGKFKEIIDTSFNPFYKNGTAEEIARIFIESDERITLKAFMIEKDIGEIFLFHQVLHFLTFPL